MEIDLDREPTMDSLGSLMHQLFLTSQDRAADLVPAYWKPCFGAPTKGSTACGSRLDSHLYSDSLLRCKSPRHP
jgi:hypothetical protein